jgi:hypothetical protein
MDEMVERRPKLCGIIVIVIFQRTKQILKRGVLNSNVTMVNVFRGTGLGSDRSVNFIE